MRSLFPYFLAVVIGVATPMHAQSFLERLGFKKRTTETPSTLDTLTSGQVAEGLKEALARGVGNAVAILGKDGGFLKDEAVRIPMPEGLQTVEKTLRTLRQDRMADDFVKTLNRAAEQAAPEAAQVLGDAIKQMSLADAKSILTSSNTAATAYFQRTSTTNLFERFLPIVRKTTAAAGVTSSYKQMMAKVPLGGSFLSKDAVDLDAYVTRKSLDGLFLKIAEEEKRIRENPVARTTDLLQKVFGAVP